MGLDQNAYSLSPGNVLPINEAAEAAEMRTLAYWRKHPNLQGWMETLYYGKGGDAESFNQVPVELTLADIDDLERAIRGAQLPSTNGPGRVRVGLVDPSEAIAHLIGAAQQAGAEVVQIDSGGAFFFGSDSDQHYFEEDIAFCRKARVELAQGRRVFYDSWW